MGTEEAHVTYDLERKAFRVVVVKNNTSQILAGVSQEAAEKTLILVAYTDTRQQAVNLATETTMGKVRGKTVEDFLFELPDPYRTRALVQTDDDKLMEPANDMVDALTTAFDWGESEEGVWYWLEFVQANYPEEVEHHEWVVRHERKFNQN